MPLAYTVSDFDEQVRRHKDRVYGYACYMLHDRQEAADVTQEVLMRFWHHFDELDTDRTLGWLMRTTRNACIDALRKRQSQRRVMEANPDAVAAATEQGPTPARRAESADLQHHLKQAMARLDEPYRSVVILREVQGLAYKDISGALDMPLNTVKVYLHRGRKKLRTQLKEITDYELA